MNKLERRMIDLATKKHDKIYPCATKQQLTDCFTRHENMVFFWYNTEDHSTHVIKAKDKKKINP